MYLKLDSGYVRGEKGYWRSFHLNRSVGLTQILIGRLWVDIWTKNFKKQVPND